MLFVINEMSPIPIPLLHALFSNLTVKLPIIILRVIIYGNMGFDYLNQHSKLDHVLKIVDRQKARRDFGFP